MASTVKNTTVLLVDEEPRLLHNVLQRLPRGFDSRTAATTEEAVEILRSKTMLHGVATDVLFAGKIRFDVVEAWREKRGEAKPQGARSAPGVSSYPPCVRPAATRSASWSTISISP